MNLTTEQHAILDEVAKARERRERAERDARRIALEALANGLPHTRVADALGITRMTIWRWLKELEAHD
jgi:transcriptional regulator with PAS, ATPase and Fis domain